MQITCHLLNEDKLQLEYHMKSGNKSMYIHSLSQIDGEYELQQFFPNLQVHRKMERKQLPLVLTRLVSHPGFFLFCFLFLFSNSSFFTTLLSSLLIITVINCSTLQVHKANWQTCSMQCSVDSLKLRCVYIDQVRMAGQGVSPTLRTYGMVQKLHLRNA